MGVKYANTCGEAYPHTYFMWFFLTLTWHWFQEKFNNQILHLSIKLGRFSVLLFRNFETVFFFTILLPPYHFSCNPMWIKKNLKLFCQPWSRNSYRPIKKMRMMINGFKERKKTAPILWSSRQGEKCGCSVVGRLGQTGMPLRPGLAVRGGVQSHRDSLPTSSVARTTHTHTCGNTSNAINTIARGQMLIHSTQWKGKAHKKNLDVWCHTCLYCWIQSQNRGWFVSMLLVGHTTQISSAFSTITLH